MRVRSLPTVLALAVFAAAAPAAHADSPIPQPQDPVVGQPVTVTQSWPEYSGPAYYSWDLDGNGSCETPWVTDPSPITLNNLPVGMNIIGACRALTPGGPSTYCTTGVWVRDGRNRPRIVALRFDTSGLFSSGAHATVQWGFVPPPLTWASFYIDASSGRMIPLTASGSTSGASSTVDISAVPAGAGTTGELWVRAFFADAPPSNPLSPAAQAVGQFSTMIPAPPAAGSAPPPAAPVAGPTITSPAGTSPTQPQPKPQPATGRPLKITASVAHHRLSVRIAAGPEAVGQKLRVKVSGAPKRTSPLQFATVTRGKTVKLTYPIGYRRGVIRIAVELPAFDHAGKRYAAQRVTRTLRVPS